MITSEIIAMILQYGALLLLALIVAEIFKRIRQSEVIGYILLGIILGPSFLSLIHTSEVFEFLSELGAMMLLFVAGLETNIEMISRGGKIAILLAILGVTFSFFFVMIPVYLMTNNFVLAVFAGSASVATSVGISIKVFSDLGLIRSEEAQLIIISAVLDDIIGIIFLSIAISVVTSGVVKIQNVIQIIASVVAFFIFMIGLSVIISRYVLEFIDRLKASGAREVFAFSFALLAGYLAYAYGLSPIIGAYMAGLILAGSEAREEIIRDISPIAFITTPIFFINVGVSADIKVAGAAFIPAVIISVAACIAKVISGVLSLDPRQPSNLRKGVILGIGMMPRGEVGLIFLKVGDSLGILSPGWYFSLLIMVMTTTFIAPILLTIILERYKAESRRVIE